MGKGVFGVAIAILAIIGAGQWLIAQEPSGKVPPAGKVGRYQIVSTGPTALLLDTATGRVWSRNFQGEWRDEGNPTTSPPRPTEPTTRKSPPRPTEPEVKRTPPPSLKLPERSVEITITQRETRPVPGSEGTVRIKIGDVTNGQVFLEVLTDNQTLVPRKSLRQGDAVEFSLDGKKYLVRLAELHDILIGEDWAKVTVEEVGAPDAPKKKGKKKRELKEPKDPPGKSATETPDPIKK